MNVYVLIYSGTVVSVHQTEDLAKDALVKDALMGITIQDALIREMPMLTEPTNPLDDSLIVEAIRDRRKIQAIKRYRELNHGYGMGLREAKEAIEKAEHLIAWKDNDWCDNCKTYN